MGGAARGRKPLRAVQRAGILGTPLAPRSAEPDVQLANLRAQPFLLPRATGLSRSTQGPGASGSFPTWMHYGQYFCERARARVPLRPTCREKAGRSLKMGPTPIQ